MAWTVVQCRESPVRFGHWLRTDAFSAIEDHPHYGAFGRSYYPLIYGKDRQDLSFAVLCDGQPCLIACCSLGASEIDYYGLPSALFVAASLSDDVAGRAIAVALDLLQKQACRRIDLTIGTGRQGTGQSQPRMAEILSTHGFKSNLRHTGLCELSLNEDEIRSSIRKSYRSLINWGKRTLQTSFVNADNPDRNAFARYQEFHLKIAGRNTRSQDTWDAMFNWIAGGGGELLLCRLESGDLVAGTMVVDGRTVAYYVSGVYDRERFDKPMAHWPLYNAILRSRERGMTWFELGDIPDEGTASDKEYSIGYFKRGFATDIRSSLTWSHKAAEDLCR